ncbi:zinc-ribbon domain-containing protein [Polaromonas sp.]
MPPSNYGGQPPAPSGTARAKCGADAPAGAKFCPGCGKSVPS